MPRVAALLSAALLVSTLAGCGVSRLGATPSARYEISVGHVQGLGRVLVDASGRTLYLYLPDHRRESRCDGFCAHQWPPLVVSSAAHARFGPGVDALLVGSVRRAGGDEQVTYNGWPLYTWSLDSAPGQANGEADAMGLWWAVSPSGTAVKQ